MVADDVFVEGWTEPIEYDLVKAAAGALEAAFDATGMTPALELCDRDGTAITTAPRVDWAEPTQSRIRWSPLSGDFVAANGPYYARWKVTDTDGAVAFFPRRELGPLVWDVQKPAYPV